MKNSSLSAFSFCVAISFAACGSVQTQTTNEPQVIQPTPTPASSAAAPAPAGTAVPSTTVPPASSGKFKNSYNSVYTTKPVIAITFDDGPHPTLTPRLLDMLKQRNIKATFYVVGQNAAEYPEIIKRMDAEGHELGNHSWSHPALNKLSPDGVRSQMDKTSEAIFAAIGKRPPTMRPPYGATSAALNARFANEFGMPSILWSVDPLDWRRPGAAVITSRIVSNTHPGAIILVHDIHPGTVDAMPRTLDELLAKGYQFVTVTELLKMDEPRPTPTPKPSISPSPEEAAPVPTPAASASPSGTR